MDPRRVLIADTSLQLVGEAGIRALTHHRIDDLAGLARGSTSYYCRRRVDILRLAIERLYVLDAADLTAAFASASDQGNEAILRAAAELIHRWLEPPARLRSIARVELFMAASHEPELQPLLHEQLGALRTLTASIADRGAADRISAGFMLADGLMLGVLREGAPAPSVGDIMRLLTIAGGSARLRSAGVHQPLSPCYRCTHHCSVACGDRSAGGCHDLL